MAEKRTAVSAHDRIDKLDMEMVEVKTIVKIQLKDLYTRVKLIQNIIIGASGAIILMLATVISRIG
tara:strand:- start:802 stop:999 length:198 start_codon:yes stop_codon:yes gene_type:complete